MNRQNIRNIAIIAHVDHGKTTLVDAMLKQTGAFRENEQVAVRVMDSNDLEKERGITILAKNTSFVYKDILINIVDTPGHADFGGEVERSLSMVDGVLLLVDAFEGCMPQTRTVLKKALELGLAPIIVINKIDRPNARPKEVVEEVYDLLIDLGATEEQLFMPIVYASGRDGKASLSYEEMQNDLKVLFDIIVEQIPCPQGNEDAPFQMLVSNIDFNEYTGRIAVGKITSGSINEKTFVSVCRYGSEDSKKNKIASIFTFDGLKKKPVTSASAGEIVCISGIPTINIGDTICDSENIAPLPFVEIEKPVLSMMFSVNTSPFAGNEGDFVTSRHLRERLYRELESNISLTVEDTDSADTFKVSGRGELHLSVLIENMRRQGYEFQVSKPTVILKEIDGVVCEPYEHLYIDVPEEFSGTVIEYISKRKGELIQISTTNNMCRLEFSITSKGLIGCRSDLMTATKGNAVVNTLFDGYYPAKSTNEFRAKGSLIAWEDGVTTSYGLYNAQDRGAMFISVALNIYEGMIIGEANDQNDLVVNPCKKKHLTAIRSTGADEALRLVPPKVMSLEKCLEFIAEDELLEVTPQSLRLRKKILNNEQRAKINSKLKPKK